MYHVALVKHILIMQACECIVQSQGQAVDYLSYNYIYMFHIRVKTCGKLLSDHFSIVIVISRLQKRYLKPELGPTNSSGERRD